MPALNTDVGVTGAKRQSWRAANPSEILMRLISENPDASKAEINALCWEATRRSADHKETFFEYWFDNNYRRLTKEPPDQEARAAAAAEAQARTDDIRQQIEAKIEGRVKIALLEMVLPSGKPVSDSTREELIDVGGWHQRVAERLQPGQTVAEAGLTEDQLRDLYAAP